MPDKTIFWHDYETFGVNPALDRPAQFAGIRTDEALEIVGDPVVVYCQPTKDVLPTPEACLITGITPQIALEKGEIESSFIAQIHQQLALPGTCGAGYNSLRFDDEVTRYTLYRNFYDPYAREWQDQCSRWDIIDLIRMAYALRPEGLEWPMEERVDEGGNEGLVPSFRLERLSEVNGIVHESAHDAVSDVQATIGLARRVKALHPKLYTWLYDLRNKHRVAEHIDISAGRPLVHTTRMYPASLGCTSLVLPLGYESRNKSSVLVYDLRVDPDEFLELDQSELSVRLFSPKQDLPEGANRLPVKSLKINKCPAIAPVSTLTEALATRIHLDLDRCARNRRKIIDVEKQGGEFFKRIESLFADRKFPHAENVDQGLYDGFFGDNDKRLMQKIRQSAPDKLQSEQYAFNDGRLPELLFRYRARNWPESLNQVEQEQWYEHCMDRYQHPERGLEPYFAKITALKDDDALSPEKLAILEALEHWGDSLL